MKKAAIGTIFALAVSGCGGGGGKVSEVSASAAVIRSFADETGVARLNFPDVQMYLHSSDISEVVKVLNSQSVLPLSDVDERDFPVFMKTNGYELREGEFDGGFLIIINKEGDVVSAESMIGLAEYDDVDAFAIMAVGNNYTGNLSGNYQYNGVFYSENKDITQNELGQMRLTADFSNGTFSIDAAGDETFLQGDGFLNSRNGQLSSSELVFGQTDNSVTVFPDGSTETADEIENGSLASLFGTITGENGTSLVGVWHTIENIPQHRGTVIGHR